jgi:DNA polymerase IIIc chi subunit
MMHCDKKYTVITSIWKVFAILLEYCCRTDYRLLIQAISKEHKDELDRLEKEY